MWLYFPTGFTEFRKNPTQSEGFLYPNVFNIHKMRNLVKNVHNGNHSTIMNTPKGAPTLFSPISWDNFTFISNLQKS